MAAPNFSTVLVGREGNVGLVTLHRPARGNALDDTMFEELPAALAHVAALDDVRVVVLRGDGAHFCVGLDLDSASVAQSATSGAALPSACPARERLQLLRRIEFYQEAVNALERCPVPVIAAIQGACIGGGVDIVTAADLRYCTADASFSVKEVDVAITADLGSLQRLPRIVGDGIARELALTGRTFRGAEAKSMGLVAECFSSSADMSEAVMSTARAIAAKSPLAVTGTKAALLHARDHTVADGLAYIATRNAALLLSADLTEALRSRQGKRKPLFAKL